MEVYLYAFLTSAPDGGEWSASHHSRLPLGKKKVPNGQEAWWATELLERVIKEKKNPFSAPAGNRTPVAQSLDRLSYLGS